MRFLYPSGGFLPSSSSQQDVRGGAGALDSVPFKAIAAGKAGLRDAVKKMNPIAAAAGIFGTMKYAFSQWKHYLYIRQLRVSARATYPGGEVD
jgi:hypothetical protein